MVRVTLLVVLCIISFAAGDDHKEDSGLSFPQSETCLLKSLLDGYDRRVRPQKKTEVAFGINLQEVVSYKKEGNGYRSFVFNLWHYFQHNDARLKWNETEYGGVQSVMLPLDDIWMPDVTLYNSLRTPTRYDGQVAVVYSNGDVIMVPPVNEEVMCSPDDPNQWRCDLTYGSWHYDGSKLNLTSRSDEMDLATYSGRFRLESNVCQRNMMTYECCPEPYTQITCSLVINGF